MITLLKIKRTYFIYKCSFIYTCFSDWYNYTFFRNNSDTCLNNLETSFISSDCCRNYTFKAKSKIVFKAKLPLKANIPFKAVLFIFVRRVTDEKHKILFIKNLRKVYILIQAIYYYKKSMREDLKPLG